MQVQVLVATMNQIDYSLLEKMNIQTDAIVGNQCDRNAIEHFVYKGNNITYLNFAERGVGLNRNNALMRADADICLFADDDMVYVDNYHKLLKDAFINNPEADVIVFNVEEPNVENSSKRYRIKEVVKVHRLNYLRYGTARIAFRLKSVRENGIYFNQCFGGGTEHCHGEDNLFLTECLNKKLRIVAVPVSIATLTEERLSTWNQGYNKKYLRDQGALYRAISKRWWRFLCLQDALRRHNSYNMSALEAYKIMLSGN